MSGTFPVIETFGPTVQGEGPAAGLPCSFVRFGGCDWRCDWCDSMHAVDPGLVRANAEHLDPVQIADRVTAPLVILSGGNPALLALEPLVFLLHERGQQVHVETQGSKWRHWLGMVDRLIVSPKPPSSSMVSDRHDQQRRAFLDAALEGGTWDQVACKIVVRDEVDLTWARGVLADAPAAFKWAGLSCYTDRDDTVESLAARYRWLIEAALKHRDLERISILPQLHVVAFGHALGV